MWPSACKPWAISESRCSAGTQPLSQRTHLGRSSKAAAQKKLHEVSDEEAEDEDDDDDDDASSGAQHCNVLHNYAYLVRAYMSHVLVVQ